MSKRKSMKRWIALLLSIVMVLGMAIPASATSGGQVEAANAETKTVKVTDRLLQAGDDTVSGTAGNEEGADPNETVRVSIVLEKASTIAAGYSAANIAANASAMSYRDGLRQQQATVQTAIERVTGTELEVVWNLTLAANIISANVKRGDIETIAKVAGVKEVVEETQYFPAKVSVGGTLQPNMAVSSEMTGAAQVWELDITGKGQLGCHRRYRSGLRAHLL